MILRNTSSYPTDEVRALVGFATADRDMRRVCVNVKGAPKGWGGAAYDYVPSVSNAPPSCDYLVTLTLGREIRLPYTFQYRKRSKRVRLYTWREVLVYVAAHEAKHVEQFKENLRQSEVVAERAAFFALRRFRAERVAA